MFVIMSLLRSMCGSVINGNLFPVCCIWGIATSCLTGSRRSKDDLRRKLTLSGNLFPMCCFREDSVSCLTGLCGSKDELWKKIRIKKGGADMIKRGVMTKMIYVGYLF